jgi:glycerol-3-phosphate acyltransferase PlsY
MEPSESRCCGAPGWGTAISYDLPLWMIAAFVIGGYLLGSIPFGLFVTRLGGAGDIRAIGSGNIGATNVLRTGRKGLAALTLAGDMGKGALAVSVACLIADRLGPAACAQAAALAGGAAFLGHVYPVWLKFDGGKGVAVFFGVLLAAAWPVGVLGAITWLAMAQLFRFSSLAALAAAALAPLFAFASDQPNPIIVLTVAMGVVIFVRHQKNILRLLAGSEPRIGDGKTPQSADAA